MFYYNKNPKEIKRERLKRNVARGRAAEMDVVGSDAIFGGWNSKKTGKGHDYFQTRTNFFTGKKEFRYKEIKSGNAKLSKLQKRKRVAMKKKGIKYVVDRRNPLFY